MACGVDRAIVVDGICLEGMGTTEWETFLGKIGTTAPKEAPDHIWEKILHDININPHVNAQHKKVVAFCQNR